MNPDFEKLFEEINKAMKLIESFDDRLLALEGTKSNSEPTTQSPPNKPHNTSSRSGFVDGIWRSERTKPSLVVGTKYWPISDDEFCPKTINNKSKRIAVIVGHNAIVKGAYSDVLGVHEYDFNLSIAENLKAFSPFNVNIEVFNRSSNVSRRSIREGVMREHSINPFDAIIEMHFNSFGSENAKGGECLISKVSSRRNKELGKVFYDKLIDVMETKPRGLKEISKGDRGFSNIDDFRSSFGFEGPVLIAEPFFGSNSSDCESANENILSAYYQAIEILAEKL